LDADNVALIFLFTDKHYLKVRLGHPTCKKKLSLCTLNGVFNQCRKKLRKTGEGASVIINSRTNVLGGETVAQGIRELGGKALYIKGDLSNMETVKYFFKEVIKKFGTVDILINNAGKTNAQEIEHITKNHWVDSINDNLMPTVLCSKEAIKIMKLHGCGAIINTSSIRGLDNTGREGIMAYSAAKAAINNFTKTIAKAVAPEITVNAIAPGFVKTDSINSIPDTIKENWMKLVPIERFITPDEIANAYLFLASAPYITGTILIADGGFSLKLE